jgi:hypothetical protein
MSYVRILGLCLMAAFASAAVAATAASAELPEVYQCGLARKVSGKYTGHYVGKKCGESEKATKAQEEEGKKNKYEFEPWNLGSKTEKTGKQGKSKPFKGKGGGADLAIEGVDTVTCGKSTDSGEFTGPKTAGDVVAVFSGCEITGHKCSNTSKAGEIKTNPMEGEVGYINKANKEAGADLKPETGLYFAEFECGSGEEGLHVRVTGSVIGTIAPINKFSKEATFSFKETNGKQHPEEFEGGVKDTLISELCKGEGCTPSGNNPSGEETIVTNKGEELELKA